MVGRRQKRQLPKGSLEYVAENMKERIYATITLLAVIVALWQTADEHSVGGAIASMAGTVTALWLATLVAARMSHRAVHGKSMAKTQLAKFMFTSSGLFVPAILPILFVLVSGTGIVRMKTALVASVAALLLSLFVLSFAAGRRIYTNPVRLVLISVLEMLVGVGVVVLKLVVGE